MERNGFNFTTIGGTGGKSSNGNGGAGGAGTSTIGKITNGQFQKIDI